jgi:hypothetical protein
MRHGTSTTKDLKSAGVSRLRLRVGVLLILLWLIPFWALAPHIAHSLSGLSNPPSVAAVTTAIVVVQTIVGLLGFWVAGTEVKSIIRAPRQSTLWEPFGRYSCTGRSNVTTTSALT